MAAGFTECEAIIAEYLMYLGEVRKVEALSESSGRMFPHTV